VKTEGDWTVHRRPTSSSSTSGSGDKSRQLKRTLPGDAHRRNSGAEAKQEPGPAAARRTTAHESEEQDERRRASKIEPDSGAR
jgi:hypothetical protein